MQYSFYLQKCFPTVHVRVLNYALQGIFSICLNCCVFLELKEYFSISTNLGI